MPSPNYVQLNISIPREVRDDLKRLCNEAGVSLAQAITDFRDACLAENRLITTNYKYPEPLKKDVSSLRDSLTEMKRDIARLTEEMAEIKSLSTPKDEQLELIPDNESRIYSDEEVAEITGLKVQTVKNSANPNKKTSPTIIKHGFVKVVDGWKKE